MNESIKAEFSFTDYRIPEASVRFKKENNDNEELSLGLAPKGVYDIKELMEKILERYEIDN